MMIHICAVFYGRIYAEIDLDRPFNGIEICKNEQVRIDGRSQRQNRIHVHQLRDCLAYAGTPLLILDADADKELNGKIFRREIEHVEICAKRQAPSVESPGSRV